MITAAQLVAHAVGDHLLQSDWMATEKTKKSVAALAHVVMYTLPFLLFTTAPLALLTIAGTHFVIDRWRLARYVVWAKNWLGPKRGYTVQRLHERMVWDTSVAGALPGLEGIHYSGVKWEDTEIIARTPPWADCTSTGYPPDRPAWLAVWLLIIADNTLHVICNGLALAYLA